MNFIHKLHNSETVFLLNFTNSFHGMGWCFHINEEGKSFHSHFFSHNTRRRKKMKIIIAPFWILITVSGSMIWILRWFISVFFCTNCSFVFHDVIFWITVIIIKNWQFVDEINIFVTYIIVWDFDIIMKIQRNE